MAGLLFLTHIHFLLDLSYLRAGGVVGTSGTIGQQRLSRCSGTGTVYLLKHLNCKLQVKMRDKVKESK
jgi:hypothetical protein